MELSAAKRALIKELASQGIKDGAVLEAMIAVPRHLFVPKDFIDEAYANYPLPIAGSQTISQPYTVAVMLEALELKPGMKVLEVGTGSGWNAALIGHLVSPGGFVFTTEIVHELVEWSKKNIEKAGIDNVSVIEADGSCGLRSEAPFDRCIVTAACPKMPPPLIEQLKEGGIIVAPIGHAWEQELIKAVKTDSKLQKKALGSFMFVPLKGKWGFM